MEQELVVILFYFDSRVLMPVADFGLFTHGEQMHTKFLRQNYVLRLGTFNRPLRMRARARSDWL